jgi:hypothetical protein
LKFESGLTITELAARWDERTSPQRFAGSDDIFDNIYIAHFVMATDVINLALTAFMNDKINGFAMIFNIEPVTHIKPLTVNRERLII